MRTRGLQRGFTLVELLVVLGLVAVLTGILVTIMYQFWRIPQWGNAQLAVDSDLRNLGLWLVRDGNESRTFTPGGTCGTFQTGHGASYTYELVGSTLQRTDGEGKSVAVARHVLGVSCSALGDRVVVTVQLGEGPVTVSETFTVTMRVE